MRTRRSITPGPDWQPCPITILLKLRDGVEPKRCASSRTPIGGTRSPSTTRRPPTRSHRALRGGGARASAADRAKPRPRRRGWHRCPGAGRGADGGAGPRGRFRARHGRARRRGGPAQRRRAGHGRPSPRPARRRLRRGVLDLRGDHVPRLAKGPRRDGARDTARGAGRRGDLAGPGRGDVPAARRDPPPAVPRPREPGDARRGAGARRSGRVQPGTGRGRGTRPPGSTG